MTSFLKFDPAQDSARFALPNYDLTKLISMTYEAIPDSVVFRKGTDSYRGWFAPLGNPDLVLPKPRASWSQNTETNREFVPTAINTDTLNNLRSNAQAAAIPLEWTLEFSAWENDKTTGTWQAGQAQVQIKGSLARPTGTTPSTFDLNLLEISAPGFAKVPANAISSCVSQQVYFWGEANYGPKNTIYPPEWILFPCERLPGMDHTVAIADAYKTDAKVRAAIDEIHATIPVVLSYEWEIFDLHLARQISQGEFPFAPKKGLLDNWKHYFDYFSKPDFTLGQALQLSSRVAHGKGCSTHYSPENLNTFAKGYLAAATDFARDEVLTTLRRTCPGT